MKITRTSIYSGKTRTKEINVTEKQVKEWEDGLLIQMAMPGLTPDDREFIMSGVTPEEWEDMHDKKSH